jgi:phage terminase large subunit-like protein
MAANRVGKSFGLGGYETALHLTGWYPEWWEGFKFRTPVKAWVAGDTSQTTRDVPQAILMGQPGELGTGLIPADKIDGEPIAARGISGSIDTVRVKHASGGTSILQFKSYDQGRKKFQGTSKEWIWLDEEPPRDVYDECRTRIMDCGGRMVSTFTPLEGLTDVALMFMPGYGAAA